MEWCGFFPLTATKGHGAGESRWRFPTRAGDRVLADRGDSTAQGIHHVATAGSRVLVRVNTGSPGLRTTGADPFAPLAPLAAVTSLVRAGAARAWLEVAVEEAVAAGRVGAIRKTPPASRAAPRKLCKEAARKGNRVHPRTLELARPVIVSTPFSEPAFAASQGFR